MAYLIELFHTSQDPAGSWSHREQLTDLPSPFPALNTRQARLGMQASTAGQLQRDPQGKNIDLSSFAGLIPPNDYHTKPQVVMAHLPQASKAHQIKIQISEKVALFPAY